MQLEIFKTFFKLSFQGELTFLITDLKNIALNVM